MHNIYWVSSAHTLSFMLLTGESCNVGCRVRARVGKVSDKTGVEAPGRIM